MCERLIEMYRNVTFNLQNQAFMGYKAYKVASFGSNPTQSFLASVLDCVHRPRSAGAPEDPSCWPSEQGFSFIFYHFQGESEQI